MYDEYLPEKNKRRKINLTSACVTLTVVLLVTGLIFTYTTHSPEYFHRSVGPFENVSCYYVTDGDALPTIDEHFMPSSNSIFFHETSCQGRLNSRQACAIESAARTHPDWEIHVLFSAPVNNVTLSDVNMQLLTQMKNVFFSRVHIVDYGKRTPAENFVKSGAINRTLWPITNTKDVLKYLTLYKWGGVVLDLDTIVVKPLDGLGRNWAIKENRTFLRSEALAFHKKSGVGTLVADMAIRLLAKKFQGGRGQNGGRVITEVIKNVCGNEDLTFVTPHICLGFEVHLPSVLLSLNTKRHERNKDSEYNITNNYLFHFISRPFLPRTVNKDAVYSKLAKRYCPLTYEEHGDFFTV